jgi:threonine synthase
MDAVLNCLPDDGGLYVPNQEVDLKPLFLDMDEKTSFRELTATVTPLLFKGCLNTNSAAKVAESAYDFEPELIKLDEEYSILNLHNGPTGVFKDFGIAFISAVLEEIRGNKDIMVLSAASPDTGVSMASAFNGKKGISLVLLYPEGQIKGLDPSTFVQNGGNIIPIQIKGTFDDCQYLVIKTILDRKFSRRYNVTSANSINPGRLFSQIFYYLYAFIRIKKNLDGDLIFSVPSGNFGNLISGLYSWKFGMPVNGFIAAMNKNNSFGDYILGKAFTPGTLIHTNSSALDVSAPANYERLAFFYDEAPVVMRNMVYPASIDDELTIQTINYVRENYNIFVDPQTAVGFAASQKITAMKEWDGHSHIIILSTGHPARSADIIKQATGKNVEIPGCIAELQKKCDPLAVIPVQLDAFENAIAGCF